MRPSTPAGRSLGTAAARMAFACLFAFAAIPGRGRNAGPAGALATSEAPPSAPVQYPPPPLSAAQQAVLKGPLADFAARFGKDTGVKLVPIPAGTFTMGREPVEPGRTPGGDNPISGETSANYLPESEHDGHVPPTQVTLTKDFFLGTALVTQRQWSKLMGANPSSFKGPDLPVETVDWVDAVVFCEKLTEQERAAGHLPAGWIFTLPTEAQWEYAGRAGATGPWAAEPDRMAWRGAHSEEPTHLAGSTPPNAWGLYDMNGNTWAWCADLTADYPGGSLVDPAGPADGFYHVLRCGSGRIHKRTSDIDFFLPPGGLADHFAGFRIALSEVVNPNFARYVEDVDSTFYGEGDFDLLAARGVYRDSVADYDGAISDFVEAIKLAGDDAAYERFFLLLTLRRLHRPEAPAGLAAALPGWTDRWHVAIGRYLTDGMPEKNFLAAAGQGGDNSTLLAQYCEACYYVGMTHLLAGDPVGAKPFFAQCLHTGKTDWQEFKLAEIEWWRLRTPQEKAGIAPSA